MNVLCIGDIFGKPGRLAVKGLLPILKKEKKIDFVVANIENAAAGFGITPSVAQEIYESGVDVLTSGNHIWDKEEVLNIIDSDPNLLRPANYPPAVPGRGTCLFQVNGLLVGVINLIGRVYMKDFESPFTVGLAEVEKLLSKTKVILVDMHAEVTSEKRAIGWYLDGKVSAVFGTHTHIQTADEAILPKGTAYITDLGMTGPHDSVIGVKKDIILKRFLTQLPTKLEVANEDIKLCGAFIEIDVLTGKAKRIERIQKFFHP